MITVVRRVQFSAGHRLYRHPGRCAHLHGHNYVALFHATADGLDDAGMVMDFDLLKKKLGGWIDEHLDHGFICYEQDHDVRTLLESIPGQKVFLMNQNPTVENLAMFLLHEIGPKQLANTGVKLVRVELWETENCRADVCLTEK